MMLRNGMVGGTALKPALEPITLARKPLSEKTIVENVLKYGTGGINIDGSRVVTSDQDKEIINKKSSKTVNDNYAESDDRIYGKYELNNAKLANDIGRFPANLIHDGSDEVEEIFPYTKTGDTKSIPYTNTIGKNVYGKQTGIKKEMRGDSGSASRFFYCAKTSKKDRGENNNHPTVKPTDLMRYLVKLITPKEGVCLDPFMGSGSTGKACKIEDFDFIGIDLDSDYVEIARNRITNTITERKLF